MLMGEEFNGIGLLDRRAGRRLLLIKVSRSRMEVLDVFAVFCYPCDIGPAATTSTCRGWRRPWRWWGCSARPTRCWTRPRFG